MKQTLDFLLQMIKHRRLFSMSLIIVIIASVIIVFLVPVLYTANITILPPDDSQQSLLGSLTSISKQATGISVGGFGAMTVDLYSDMLRSDMILDSIILKYSLMQKWGYKSMIFTRRKLKRNTKINISTSEMLVVSYTDRDPEFAADVCNDYVYFLNQSLARIDSIKLTDRIRMMEIMLTKQEMEIKKMEDAYMKWQKENNSEGLESSSMYKTPALNFLYTKLAEEQLDYYIFSNDYKYDSKTLDNQKQMISSIERAIDSTLQIINSNPKSVVEYNTLKYEIESAVIMKKEIESRIKYTESELNSMKNQIYTMGESEIPDFKSFPPKKIIVVLIVLIMLLIDILYVGIAYYSEKNLSESYRKELSANIKKVFNDPFQTSKK